MTFVDYEYHSLFSHLLRTEYQYMNRTLSVKRRKSLVFISWHSLAVANHNFPDMQEAVGKKGARALYRNQKNVKSGKKEQWYYRKSMKPYIVTYQSGPIIEG